MIKLSRKHREKHGWTGLWFVLPDLLGVAVFSLIPMAEVLRRSFLTLTGSWTGLRNYRTVLHNAAFRLAALNTLRFTAVCIPLLVVSSLALALALQKLGTLGTKLKSLFLMPMAVPAASVVLVWKVLFHDQGLINRAVLVLSGEAVGFMTTDAAFWMLVVSYLWKNLGYDMILWLAGLAGISPNLYEAARVDGAGEWQCFLHITLPSLKPSLYTISVLSFLNAFKVFREAWLVAGDYPQEKMYLLQHLYNNWFRELSFEKIAAASVLTSAVVFALIALLRRAWDTEAG